MEEGGKEKKGKRGKKEEGERGRRKGRDKGRGEGGGEAGVGCGQEKQLRNCYTPPPPSPFLPRLNCGRFAHSEGARVLKDLSTFPITKKWPAQFPERIQLYSLPTPNGVKGSIMLEETGLTYEPKTVNFGENGQTTPAFM